jgi:hypothetical protein
MSTRWSFAAALGLMTGLAGCTHPADPIFGAWRGEQPSRTTDFTKSVELVLEGPAAAQSGRYRIATTEHDPETCGDHDTRRWAGTWASEQRVVDGRTQDIIHLHNPLPGDIGSYELSRDGSLHVVGPNGRVDESPAGKLNVLPPVSPGPGYGQT